VVETRAVEALDLELNKLDIGKDVRERRLIEAHDLAARERLYDPVIDAAQGILIRVGLGLLAEPNKHSIHIGSQEGDHLKHIGARLDVACWPLWRPVVLCELEE
jgi:hypothetical protein